MKAAEQAIKVANTAYKLSKNINNKKRKSNKIKVIGQPSRPFITPRTRRVKRLKINYGGTFNVKHDRDKWVTTFKKQKVTKQQQRKINRRFKNGQATPYVLETENRFIDTTTQRTDQSKFMWFTHFTMGYVQQAWRNFKFPESYNTYTNDLGTTNNNNIQLDPNQSIYFSKCTSKYEIFNPTNYDMTVVIYDIVCKEDTRYENTSFMVNSQENELYEIGPNVDNPISLWDRGYRMVKGRYNLVTGTSTTQTTQVSSPSVGREVWDIQSKPTDSYPFNMHYKIVKKRTFKLQPGANMHHKFIWRPKCLMSRGYYGYKYADNPQGTLVENGSANIAIKNLTCGTLFKFYGQISGDTSSVNNASGVSTMKDEKAVTNLSGRLMVKEWCKINTYYCAPKAGYYERIDNGWTPADEEDLNIPTDVKIEPANDDMELGGVAD